MDRVGREGLNPAVSMNYLAGKGSISSWGLNWGDSKAGEDATAGDWDAPWTLSLPCLVLELRRKPATEYLLHLRRWEGRKDFEA